MNQILTTYIYILCNILLLYSGMLFYLIYSKPDGFFTNIGFMSEVLTNPSYLDLLHVADKEIETTQDLEHVIKQVNKDLHQIELMLGS